MECDALSDSCTATEEEVTDTAALLRELETEVHTFELALDGGAVHKRKYVPVQRAVVPTLSRVDKFKVFHVFFSQEFST